MAVTVICSLHGTEAARSLLGSSPAPSKLGYVPKGCSLDQIEVDASYAYKYGLLGARVIRGIVIIRNGKDYAIPVFKVQVTLAPAVPVSPFILTATCKGSSVPSSPKAYDYGKLICTFESPTLPTSGPAAGFGGWKTAAARVTIGMSGATCDSPIVPIRGWILTDILEDTGSSSSSSSTGKSSTTSTKGSGTSNGKAPLLMGSPTAGNGRRLSQDAGAPLTFVPPSNDCLGMTITATAIMSSGGIVSGSVFITNPQQYAIPLSSVKVQISNNVPVAPIFADATCQGGMSVPSNPQPFQLGSLVCSYSGSIPSSGIASDPSKWVSVMPKVTVAMSEAQCSGSVVAIEQQQAPLLLGRRLSQATPLTFVPASDDCLNMTITAAATMSSSGTVSGSVFITNPQQYAIPLSSVKVQISNNVPVAPIFANATCQGGMSVPSNPQAFQVGTLVCSYSAAIPSSGVASDPSKWVGVMPKVTVAMSEAQCSGSVVTIEQQKAPLLLGH